MTNYERQKFVYGLLCKVHFDKAYCGIVLNDGIGLAPEGDRAFITKVFYGVIEKDVYLNYALSSLVKQSPQPKVALVMKIGLYQLYFTDQAPYAVVSASVDLVKSIGKKEVAGFVNATLKNYKKVLFPKQTDKINYLSVFGGVPVWLAKKLSGEYGFDQALEMLRCKLTDKTHVRNNPEVISKEELKTKYGLTDESEYGFFVGAEQLKKMAPDEYTVQSLSSMKAVKAYLGDLSRGSVLDVCAAPGGKSVYIAQSGNFTVTACDIHEHRVELIKKYAARMKVNILTVLNDAEKDNKKWHDMFDVVVCDVPCSGIGVIRSKPDVLLNRKESDIPVLAKSQKKILEVSAEYVKPGGRLCYSTCTVLKEENEKVVESFLVTYPGFELISEKTLLPQNDGCDGFFVAVMRRKG